jgi:nucleoside-diphosphate-sugar epimerase
MKVVVTGSRGKVGRATIDALIAAGHDVLGVDLVSPIFDTGETPVGRYQKADITDAGSAFAVVLGADAVVHIAAIPQPTAHPAHVVFQANVMSQRRQLRAEPGTAGAGPVDPEPELRQLHRLA